MLLIPIIMCIGNNVQGKEMAQLYVKYVHLFLVLGTIVILFTPWKLPVDQCICIWHISKSLGQIVRKIWAFFSEMTLLHIEARVKGQIEHLRKIHWP